MPHRVLVSLAAAFVAVLGLAPSAQRGAVDPTSIAGRTLSRDQLTVVSGTLTGTVRDRSRALVPGIQVTVILETEAHVAPHRTTTDQDGRFRFTGLPLGTYCLTVSPRGSNATMRTGIRVRGAQATNVPVVLGERPPTPTPRSPRRDSCS